jgi:transcriptional regulator with XRE-family HTH domain
MKELDDIAREAGMEPDSPEYRLRAALAESDGDMLECLVAMRKAKGLTQQVVADRMHRDKAAVSNFERLGTDPHLSTIRRYAAAIGVMIAHGVIDFAEVHKDTATGAPYPSNAIYADFTPIGEWDMPVSRADGDIASAWAEDRDEHEYGSLVAAQ